MLFNVRACAGRDKDAWPELLNMEVDAAVNILNSSGLVQNIYVQPPSSGPAPANLGKTTDVWIYTDGSVVYETPRRGVWHANRKDPLLIGTLITRWVSTDLAKSMLLKKKNYSLVL